MVILISAITLLAGFLLGKAVLRGKENDLLRSQMEIWQRGFERRYYNILEYSSIGMASIALGGQIIEVNQKFCDILNYHKE